MSDRRVDSAFEQIVVDAVGALGASVTPRFAPGIEGEPEDKLRGPIETLLGSVGRHLTMEVTPAGEVRIKLLGIRSDYGVYVGGLLVGHLEVKAPGKGADTSRYTGHDRMQWEKSKPLPNLLYTDGNAWGLYRQGERVRSIVSLAGDIRSSGASLTPIDGLFARLLIDFLDWTPQPPRSASALAHTVAGLCRLLRDEVMDVLDAERHMPETAVRPFMDLAADWRDLLFPGATGAKFADSYAQTVTFALLLARSEKIAVDDLESAARRLGRHHRLLGRALEVLTDEQARARVASSLGVLQRVIAAVDWDRLSPAEHPALPGFEQTAGQAHNPWLYFYEDFLADYDAKLREEAGAYYTPAEVVGAQVRLVEDVLRSQLNKDLGFAADELVILDPAMGTGSYLIQVLERAAMAVAEREGPGAVGGRLRGLTKRLIGFEPMTGPYAVAEMQVNEAFRRHGFEPSDDLRLYLTDTLADPYIEETRLGGLYEPVARSRKAANEVKRDVPVVVCLGNPPYDRHEPGVGLGGWVRYGDPSAHQPPILDSFRDNLIKPAHLANLYNLYVYFWRWGLWKVFEAHPGAPTGVVAFITASSFLTGPSFAAMRAHMRRVVDEIWVIDLGGEGRGTRREQNVFPIEVPVAITICLRRGAPSPDTPATVHYARVPGSRAAKLAVLQGLSRLDDMTWQLAERDWRATMTPSSEDDWARLPSLFDVIPWRLPGLQAGRTWPIAPSKDVLVKRWKALAGAEEGDRSAMFGSRDVHRSIDSAPGPLPGFPSPRPATLRAINAKTPCPKIERLAYRSFDRQWVIADTRLLTLPRPDLWAVRGPDQVYLTTLNAYSVGPGPAVTASSQVPDRHHFRGSYGGAALPLWRDAEGTDPNVAPGLLQHLSDRYGSEVRGADVFAYVAGVLAHSGYTSTFDEDLIRPGARIPLTTDPELFWEVAGVGRRVLWLHTFGAAFADAHLDRPSYGPRGQARAVEAILSMPDSFSYDAANLSLRVGEGMMAPVSEEVWQYEVSGLHVVDKWLGYRIRRPRGKKSSKLDAIVQTSWPADWTTELLELLWVLEALVALEPTQAELLTRVMAGTLVTVTDLEAAGLLPVADDARRIPARPRRRGATQKRAGAGQEALSGN